MSSTVKPRFSGAVRATGFSRRPSTGGQRPMIRDLSRWIWVSTSPAQTRRPPASQLSPPPASAGASATMRPPATPISTRSPPATRAFLRISSTSGVDFHQLAMRPGDGVLRLHALHRLGVHVDDDVLGLHLGGLARGRPGIAEQPAGDRDHLERGQHRIGGPHRIVLPHLGGAGGIALLRGEPFLEHRLRVDPAQELHRRLFIGRIAHHHVGEGAGQVELAARTLGQRRVKDVVLHRRALFGEVGLRLLLGLDIDRGAVVGQADRSRQEGAVVRRIVPGEAAGVAGVVPERHRAPDRFERLLGVQHDGLAVGLDLLAAPRPQPGIPEARRVAERVAERLADRPALGLQLLAGVLQLVPGVGEDVVEAALLLADLLGQLADVGEAGGVKLRPVVERHDDVRAGPRLDRRGDACLDVVAVDGFEIELDAERLLALLGDLALEQLVGSRHEIGPAHPMNRRTLGEGRRAAARQDRRDAAAGKLQHPAPIDPFHVRSPSLADYSAASVSMSKKCSRSGLSARRSRSCTLAVTVGSTEATIVAGPTATSSRISEPSRSTTSTAASSPKSCASPSRATRRSSGRMPKVTCLPTARATRPRAASGTLNRMPSPSAQIASPSAISRTGAKFIAGEPMNPATKRLAGWLYSSIGSPTCCTQPSRMTTTRSPRVIASTWSWVT